MNIERRVLSPMNEGSGGGKAPQVKPEQAVPWDNDAYAQDIRAHERMRRARHGQSTRGPDDWTAPKPPIDLFELHYGKRGRPADEKKPDTQPQSPPKPPEEPKRTNSAEVKKDELTDRRPQRKERRTVSMEDRVSLDGVKIYNLRKQRRMPQLRLADCIDATQGTISRLENGKMVSLDMSAAKEIAHALGVPLEEILKQDS